MTSGPTSPAGIPSPVQPLIDRLDGAVIDAESSRRVDVGRRAVTAVLDRFVVPDLPPPDQDGAIAQIWWEGRACSLVDTGPRSSADAAGFLITIHPDDDGRPDLDNRTVSQAFDIDEVDRTVLAARPGPCGAVTARHVHRRYRARLDRPPGLEPGQALWLSVQALVPTAAIEWAWRGSRAGDDGTSMRTVDGAVVEIVDLDRAFAIEMVMPT